MLDFRERDPLRTLPTPTRPFAGRESSHGLTPSQLRLTWMRTRRSVEVVRALAAGKVSRADGAALPYTWSDATGLQKEVVHDIWDRHARLGAWGSITDGRAVLRRLRGADASGYGAGHPGGGRRTTTSTSTYKKGDLCGMVASQVSLPPPGAVGLPLDALSPTAAPYLANFDKRMLEDPKEVDWERYHALKSYSDPGWKDKSTRLTLAMRMMQAGMVSYVTEIKHVVGLFCVAKDVSDDGKDVLKSRLIWDARKVNVLFRRPPWTPLGSPSVLSELDLSDDILDGRTLGSFQGDVPDWFYRLRWPEALAQYFTLDGGGARRALLLRSGPE